MVVIINPFSLSSMYLDVFINKKQSTILLIKNSIILKLLFAQSYNGWLYYNPRDYYLWPIRTRTKKQDDKTIEECQSYNFLLTWKMPIPRATHLTIFQFSLRNPYIASKSPVLSFGISWMEHIINEKYIFNFRLQITTHNFTYFFPVFVKEYKGCASQLYQDQQCHQNWILRSLKEINNKSFD